jgi:hypothetical protein
MIDSKIRESQEMLTYQRVISLEIQVGITSQRKNGLTHIPGYTGGGNMCLGGVRIPC